MANERTATLAQSVTRSGSKQTYYMARLMVDKGLISDFYRAYAYFRWIDDIIDKPSSTTYERISFVKRQRILIEGLYNDEHPDDLSIKEEMIAELIINNTGKNGGLRSFITNMFAIIEFDAYRKGRLISNLELTWYSDRLAQSVTDGLQYFIGNEHSYPSADNRYLAATAAHNVHLLRDMVNDIKDGFINIPEEYLIKHGLDPQDIDSPPFRAWARKRVEKAREQFREGKRYLDSLEVLRCKIMGYWYCARFEGILDAIESDGYILREDYEKRYLWLKMVWLATTVTFQHILSRVLVTRRKKIRKLT